MINKLFDDLSSLEHVEAIALGGSRSGKNFDEKSDYDVYVYITSEIDDDVRRNILDRYCSYMEIGNRYWELEDNCVLKNGVDIDIIYRSLDSFFERDPALMNLLCDAMPAYSLQIEKACKRGDRVSILHRTTAFLESYFDIIFALNSLTHPGEKRLIGLCRQNCSVLPENFEENLNTLFDDMSSNPDRIIADIKTITEALKAVIK